MEPANLLAYLKLPTRVIASVGLAALGVLFLPAPWAAALGLAQIRKQYAAPLGIAVLLAIALLVTEGIVFVSAWLRDLKPPRPYEAYRTDEFFGLRWRWRWYIGDAIAVEAFCSHCDLQLEAVLIDAGFTGLNVYQYHCPCGRTDIKLPAPNPIAIAHKIALCAEREARNRGLLDD